MTVPLFLTLGLIALVMSTKQHYETHLADFYSWMAGDFDSKQNEFQDFLIQQGIYPKSNKIALDLGAGHGIQTVSLANLGFHVTAVDFSKKLLGELRENTKTLPVEIKEGDIRNVHEFKVLKPELIICWGDTLTHLESKNELNTFMEDCCKILSPGGRLLLSFRDYSTELSGNNRFIPVKTGENRILTCFLEYEPEYVTVTDLLYEEMEGGWRQKISSYKKLRIAEKEVLEILKERKMKVVLNNPVNHMVAIVAEKL
jgi:SAM-dependent methyltransferase